MRDTARPLRLPTVDPRLLDAAVAVALLVAMLLSFDRPVQPGQRPVDSWAWLLAAALCLPFARHRASPWPALTVTLGALLSFALLHYAPYPALSVFALLFGISLHGTRRPSLVAFGATAAGLLVALAAQPIGVAKTSDWVSTMLATAVAWLAGDNLRQRRARWRAMEERARLLESEREERARAAVAAERIRIARELHDVVAHSMSVIAVQAGVGHHVIDSDIPQARAALGVIEETSRAGLVEMRRLLGVLRDGAAADRAPTPGLRDLAGLVEQTRASGLGVTLDVGPVPDELSPAVGLTAYRIVQEALTNVIKHGGPVATVRVTCPDGTVVVEVLDDGRRGSRRLEGGAGQGLVGMRERVAIFGGELGAGPRPGGGFRVFATLPYAGDAA